MQTWAVTDYYTYKIKRVVSQKIANGNKINFFINIANKTSYSVVFILDTSIDVIRLSILAWPNEKNIDT